MTMALLLLLLQLSGRLAAGPEPARAALQVAGGANAHVSLAADGDLVVAVWAVRQGAGSDVYAAVSRDGGRRFGDPVRVNANAGEAQAGGERPPRVAISTRQNRRTIAVLWGAAPPAAGLGPIVRLAESQDDGRSFAPPIALSAAGARGIRSWASLAAGADGAWHAAWLDGRVAAANRPVTAPGSAHQHGTAGSAGSTRASRGPRQDLYLARVAPDGSVHERPVIEDVCFCCKTSTLAGRDGRVRIAYRHIFPGGERDIALSVWDAGALRFAPPARVSLDHWKIDACPDDGPALAGDGSGTVHVVWPTLTDAAGTAKGVFYSRAREGQPFSPRLRLDAGTATPSHPQVAVRPDGAGLAAWDEVDDRGRRIVVAAIGATPSPPTTLAAGTYPALAAVADGFLVAWTEGTGETSVIRVLRLP